MEKSFNGVGQDKPSRNPPASAFPVCWAKDMEGGAVPLTTVSKDKLSIQSPRKATWRKFSGLPRRSCVSGQSWKEPLGTTMLPSSSSHHQHHPGREQLPLHHLLFHAPVLTGQHNSRHRSDPSAMCQASATTLGRKRNLSLLSVSCKTRSALGPPKWHPPSVSSSCLCALPLHLPFRMQVLLSDSFLLILTLSLPSCSSLA